MQNAVESHPIEPDELAFVMDAQNPDISCPARALLLAREKESLVLRAIHGQNHQLEALPAEQELRGDSIVDDLQLIVRPFGAEHLADHAYGLGVFVKHQNGVR